MCNAVQKKEQFEDNIGYSSMLGVVANKYFDNPYRAFNSNSDLNGDPYFIGYYLLGMHMLGLVRWIIETCRENDYKKILFMARDGWLPMLAYKCFKEKYSLPEYEYLYVSRKAVLPGMIAGETDLFDLPVEFRNHSPRTLLELLEFCSREMGEKQVSRILKNYRISEKQKFQTQEDYHQFIQVFIKEFFSETKLKRSQALAAEYYSTVTEDSVSYDSGYSGRIQNAVSRLCGHPADVMFVHNDLENSFRMKRKGNFKIHSYYDYVPQVSGLLREHMLSETGGGCIGFEKAEHGVVPVIESVQRTYADVFVIEQLHKGAIDFIEDYLNEFEGFEQYIEIRNTDASAPFEAYLKRAKDVDRWLFKGAYFEDSVYGGNSAIDVYEFLKGQDLLNVQSNVEMKSGECQWEAGNTYDVLYSILNTKSKFVRAILLLLIDKNIFKKKLKKNVQKLLKH